MDVPLVCSFDNMKSGEKKKKSKYKHSKSTWIIKRIRRCLTHTHTHTNNIRRCKSLHILEILSATRDFKKWSFVEEEKKCVGHIK